MSSRVSRAVALMAQSRLVIFDADGTLRRTVIPGAVCPHAPGEWELIPDVREIVSAIDWCRNGPLVAVASNQDHVGYGLVDERMAARLLRDMLDAAAGRALPDALIRFCPHVIEAQCGCRKPAPGLLVEIARDARVEPREALFVGDAECDHEAAKRAGVRFAWAHEFFERT
jgi:D-glycero-D-manno-heptose 1,7-bisphosphate phosphatase